MVIGDANDAKDPAIACGDEVYTLYEGRRHLVRDKQLLLNYGYQDSDIKSVSKEKLSKYPLGLPLIRYNGLHATVMLSGSSTIYLVVNDALQEVTDWDWFLAQGYHGKYYNVMTKDDAATYSISLTAKTS